MPIDPAHAAPSEDAPGDQRTCDQELAEIRAEFNSTPAGGWGIVVDRRAQRWTAVRGVGGSSFIVHAGSADELRQRIISGRWALEAAPTGR